MLAIVLSRFRQSALIGSICLLATVSHVAHGQAPAPISNTVPSQYYYQAVFDIYRGEYRDAQRTLMREAKNSIRIGVTQRWIDAICYHAMLGEVYYQQGNPAAALEQFDEACAMYLQYPKWMLSVEFNSQPRPDTNLARQGLPWGPSTRQFTLGKIPTQLPIRFGDDLATQNEVVQRGGTLRQLQLWQIDVVEIVRAIATAIRRRNELLGPLAPHDPLSRDLVNKLSSGTTPPNHWSNTWSDLLLGLAYAGQGNLDQAYAKLQRAERMAGRFDHQLTGIALLEQGRLAMESGKADAAERLFFEAGISAVYYEDPAVIDESFRFSAMNRLGDSNPEPNPILDAAAAWALRERLYHIYSRLSFTRSEEWMIAGNWKQAAASLQEGQSRLGDAAAGLLGNWSRYLEARVLTEMGKESAIGVLNTALATHFNMSSRFLQLQIANRWFDDRTLRASAAIEIYVSLLSDPIAKDWAFRPLDTLALLKAPLDPSYDRWIVALLERKDKTAALEVTDLAKRRRFFNELALGGRLAAIRDTMEIPESMLSPPARVVRNDLLIRFPEFGALTKQGESLLQSLRAAWQPEMDKASQQNLNRLWKAWSENLHDRSVLTEQLGLSRVPCEFQFPPVTLAADLQARLQPGQAVVVFHESADGMLGFLLTQTASTIWDCAPTGSISKHLSEFLRDLGNHDRNNSLDEKQLASIDWHESGMKLFHALFDGSSLDPSTTKELIVVPDGLVWYVPLTALPIKLEEGVAPLISHSKVRVVPTMGLAFGRAVPWRRVQHSSIVGSEIVPGDKDEDRAALLANLQAAMTNLIELPSPLPTSPPVVATALDSLVVLDEFDIELDDPLGWSPLPVGRGKESGTLDSWLNLPPIGPQSLIFAGAHTIAEKGGKAPRRRSDVGLPGNELFLASCGLLSSGAQTALLSRWRVGGQSTLEIVREFVQELPRTSAADAWQRCVEVAKELPLEPGLEPRVKLKDASALPTAGHPFFWGGFLLIDCGEPIEETVDDAPAPPVPAAP